jgi:hypothetical protein
MSDYITSLKGEYRRYKALGETAIAQLTEEQLSAPASPGGNSVAAIVWHVAGNLESRSLAFARPTARSRGAIAMRNLRRGR